MWGERRKLVLCLSISFYSPLKCQDKQGLGRSSNPFPMSYCIPVLPARLLGMGNQGQQDAKQLQGVLGCALGGDEEVEVFEVASSDCGAASHCWRRKARGWCWSAWSALGEK